MAKNQVSASAVFYRVDMDPEYKRVILSALKAQRVRLTADKSSELCPAALAVLINDELVVVEEIINVLENNYRRI